MRYLKKFENFHYSNSQKSIFEKLNLIEQPDDITCGPTCLKMISDYLDIKVTIEELKIVCGTDNLSGTTDLKMIKGLDYLNLKYHQLPLKDKEKCFNIIDDELNKGNLILFRTLVKGIKHWVVCDELNNEKYTIYDPWLGKYYLDKDELDNIWSPREYDGFVIQGVNTKNIGSPVIEKLNNQQDIKEVVHLASLIFTNVMSYDENVEYINESTDFSKSVKLTLNNEIIGCYLVNPKNLDNEDGLGIEGVALAIKPAFRKFGYGELLKNWFEDYAKSNGYSYLWGQHLKGLNNLDHWLKRRELHSEDDELFVTIKRFKK
jgi:GNAT superfamily N-acetyltransferase